MYHNAAASKATASETKTGTGISASHLAWTDKPYLSPRNLDTDLLIPVTDPAQMQLL